MKTPIYDSATNSKYAIIVKHKILKNKISTYILQNFYFYNFYLVFNLSI